MTLNRPLATLCAVAAIDMVGYGAVLPLLPFLALEMNATPLEVTVIIAAFPLAQLAMAPLLGALSDRLGRRRLIALGLLAAAASYLLFAVSHRLPLLLLSRAVAGSAGATYAVAQAYVADITAPTDRAAGMGWLGAAYGVGLVIGPALGAMMAQWGFVLPGLAAAGICAANALAAALFLPAGTSASTPLRDPQGARERAAALLRAPLPGLFAVYVMCITAFESIMAVLALYLAVMAGLDAPQAGLLWALGGIVTVAVRAGMVGRLASRHGEQRVVQSGIVVLALTMLGLTLVRSFGEACLAISLLSAGAGLVFPSLASLTSKAAPPSDRGLVLGSSQMLGGGGKVIGPIVAGALMNGARPDMPLWTAAVVLMLALLVSQPALSLATRAARPRADPKRLLN
jgi:MFS family permease